MAAQAGVNRNGNTLAGMTIPAPFGIRLMQDISDQAGPITAVRAVAGGAAAKFCREIGMFGPNRSGRVTFLAKTFGFADQKVRICGLVGPVAGTALAFTVRSMYIFIFW